ncbi:MAG: DUF1638 domain-containing protein [Robiginitomaculum sp.]
MAEVLPKTLIIACGALAKEILFLKEILGDAGKSIDLQCLPANYHNRPDKIIPGLEKVIAEKGADYDRILIGYGDCGTGGHLDTFIKKNSLELLPGAHCYAFFAGLDEFDELMEEELGSFFLTDYLVKFFDTLIIKGFGIDRYPDLKDMYFANYRRVVYLAQTEDADLQKQAQAAADTLGLAYEYRFTGYGELANVMKALTTENTHV